MLHLVNKSPFERQAFESCLGVARKGSAILLIEDGVYAALKNTPFEAKVTEAIKDVKICVLGPDLEARGVDQVIEGVEVVDYGGFVDLTTEHNPVQSWL
ncbi:MAG: sulfurtransferase complex subunit TusB [Hyphomicrobiales bacterium]|nr:MAG: sulfurtransferase complex subunit TusB [Hyphomicrobiales bacterium]